MPKTRLRELIAKPNPWALSALLVWVGLYPCPSTKAAEDSIDKVEQGHELYGELCETCHGPDMVTSGALAFDLRRFPHDAFDRFRNSVLNGKGPTMPAWRDKISDDDLAMLWAYVRSDGKAP